MSPRSRFMWLAVLSRVSHCHSIMIVVTVVLCAQRSSSSATNLESLMSQYYSQPGQQTPMVTNTWVSDSYAPPPTPAEWVGTCNTVCTVASPPSPHLSSLITSSCVRLVFREAFYLVLQVECNELLVQRFHLSWVDHGYCRLRFFYCVNL